ncbi:MAG: DEAD/DEAH box helicase [Ignavibacteriales bacterium]|nr:DEAD/DEAH box helicase [Ignavibacteriales bacterium]
MKKLLFNELAVSPEILQAVSDMGFEETTPIQADTIPHILKGSDVIGQSQTGSGKTAAFGIPMLEMITDAKSVQAITLCPTRELAIQVAEEIKELGKYKRGLSVLAIYGGQPIQRQIKALKAGAQIVIGTPGRVIDHLERHTIRFDAVKIVVLDEADIMLDMGFRDDIEAILRKVPKERQTVLFSATMPKAILELTKRYQKNPHIVKVERHALTVPKIEQVFFEVKEKNKIDTLSRLIDVNTIKSALVFCNTKRKVDEVVGHLQARGYLADGLHGDMRQSERDSVMGKFRKSKVEILVATDVAARGIDVDDVEAVFNYDVPQDEDYYVHRIGRTGRAGKSGKAFTFATGSDLGKIRDISKLAKTTITRQETPSMAEVEKSKESLFMEKIRRTLQEGHLGLYIHQIERLMEEEEYTSIDVAAALLKLTMPSESKPEPKTASHVEHRADNLGMVRCFINIGRKSKITAKDIIRAITDATGITASQIGTIDVYDKFAFVEVSKNYAHDVLKAMKDSEIKGQIINMELAEKKKGK